jgi:hypothetical protein
LKLPFGYAVAWRLDLITAAEDAAANTELLEADYHSVSNRESWDSEIFTILFCRESGLEQRTQSEVK